MSDSSTSVTQVVPFKGKRYQYTWIASPIFSEGGPVNHIECVVINNEGKFLVMKEYGNWSIPGGAPNEGESYEQAITREVLEEVNIKIGDLQMLGYNKIVSLDDSQGTFYHIVYKATVKKIMPRTPDPESGDTLDYIFVDPAEVTAYVKWGNTGAAMFKLAAGL